MRLNAPGNYYVVAKNLENSVNLGSTKKKQHNIKQRIDIPPYLLLKDRLSSKFSRKEAIEFLWLQLIKGGKEAYIYCPIMTNERSLEDEVIKMLQSSGMVTIGDLKRAMAGAGLHKDIVNKFLDTPDLKHYLNDNTLRFYPWKELSQKVAKALLNAMPAEPKTVIERTVKSPIQILNKLPTKIDKQISINTPAFENKPEKQSISRSNQTSVLRKKRWNENRVDKRSKNIPFTQVQAESLNGQLFNVELLNSVPDEVLLNNGWTKTQIDQLSRKTKKNSMSDSALKALGVHDIDRIDEQQGYYFGEGAFGTVKFARAQLPGMSKPTWCVAKKLKPKSRNELAYIESEIKKQNQSGVAPKVFGLSDTKTQQGKRQNIMIMEKAMGVSALNFRDNFLRNISLEDKLKLAKNFIEKLQIMHENNIYHSDIKLENCHINDKTLDVQYIDFGMATEKRWVPKLSFYSASIYYPPEIESRNRKYINKEKQDVYSLGVMLSEIFGKGDFTLDKYNNNIEWNANNTNNAQSIIDAQLNKMQVSHQKMKSLIQKMLIADPRIRLSLDQVSTRLNKFSGEQVNAHKPIAEPLRQDIKKDWQSNCEDKLYNNQSFTWV